MKNTNSWLQVNKVNSDIIGRRLIEYHMMGSYGGNLNLMDIKRVLDGALNEIQRLQNENDTLKETIKGVNKEINDIKNVIKS